MQIWGSSSRPTVIELKDEKGYHFYSQRNTDNSITMSVNGEVVSGLQMHSVPYTEITEYSFEMTAH